MVRWNSSFVYFSFFVCCKTSIGYLNIFNHKRCSSTHTHHQHFAIHRYAYTTTGADNLEINPSISIDNCNILPSIREINSNFAKTYIEENISNSYNSIQKPPSFNAILFTVLSAVAIMISYADRSNLSTAIIPMSVELQWNSLFSGIVLSSFWAGYALTQIIGGKLADRIGGEKLLIGGIIAWSLFTALTPVAAKMGAVAIIIVRVLLGAGEGVALPAIHSMINKYVPIQYQSTSVSIITAACYLGALVSNLLSPWLIGNYGWESCFLLFAAIPPLFWIPSWFKFLQQNKSTTQESTPKLTLETTNTNDNSPSIMELISKKPIQAIIAAQYGQSWGLIGLLSWLPTYYTEKFNIPVKDLAEFTVLPYFLQWGMSIISGNLADYLITNRKWKVVTVRKLLQAIGMLTPALCLITLVYLPVVMTSFTLTATQAALLITTGSAISAITSAAVSCNHFDISPKNAGAIFGIGNTASCIGGLIAVPLSGYIYDRTHSWDIVFLTFVLHYVAGAWIWLTMASDKVLEFKK